MKIAQLLPRTDGAARLKPNGQSRQRLDIQGLRMVAVLLVFATHLFGWPRGGFMGVDVFFVISGFLITENPLRMAKTSGSISFKKFYWNRFRRIVPAAMIVLLLTCLAAAAVFQPSRAQQISIDALFAAVFMSNWWFALRGTDYFAADDAVSPIQHYWSLSIEEQFYFVWPALIFVIGLVITRRALTDRHRTRFTAGVMACVTVASFGWAVYETAVAQNVAYFSTFARVWELGAGALLAISAGALARIPVVLKPWLSWTGICLIGGSALVIGEGSQGFPAPLALLPVAGSALVIAAGVGVEPTHLNLLTNPFSLYVGNISYSLYLVHWPVIVLLGAIMAPSGVSFYLAVVSISFALAMASYHFVEDPLRHGDWGQQLKMIGKIRITHRDRGRPRRSSEENSPSYVGLAVLTLLVFGLTAVALRPNESVQAIDRTPEPSQYDDRNQKSGTKSGPLVVSLQQEIAKALSATEWPILDPSMESVINERSVAPPEMLACAVVGIPNPDACTWGSPTATTRMVLVGDSIALTYGSPLRELALNSGGKIQLRVEAMPGCQFVDDQMKSTVQVVNEVCPSRKLHTIDVINATKPDVVIISDSYGVKNLLNGGSFGPGQWSGSMRAIVEKIRGSVKQIAWLAPPPADENVKECFSKRSSVPADCVSQVNSQWLSIADDEQQVAESLGGVWIDSRPWFCSEDQFCPAFVGSTPTKGDNQHMTPAYGKKIHQVIGETLKDAGVY